MLLMIPRSLRYSWLVFFFFSRAYSQSCPPNLDFESGNFSNWECFVGSTDTVAGKNRMVLLPSAPIAKRHEIISSAANPGLDAYGGFPTLCPYGGNFSVKLGNESTGAEAEAISYTFQVPTTVDTFTFTYFYAVVFQDPQHTLPEQPRFFVTAYDVGTGALINCASYDYVSTAALPGFQKSTLDPTVLYKNWTPTSLQFANLGGHDVRLEFRTADCTRGGHFGYAYMDIASACSNILATAPYCIETNSLILDAPFGFETYTWYNADFSAVVGTGQSFTLSPPPVTSGVFYVDVNPYPGFGCRDTLQAIVTPLPVPDTPQANPVIKYCQFQSPVPLVAKASPGHQLLWYTSATGGTGSNIAPLPVTSLPGSFKFYVSQKAIFGCEGFRREIIVNVIPTPAVSFSTNHIRQCQRGNNFSFLSKSVNLDSAVYNWDFGNGQTYSSTDTFSVYTYSNPGSFNVKLKVINANTCAAEKTQLVTVVPPPLASFAYPPVICENQTPITLTDHSAVPLGVSTINSWWWNINGTIVQGQKPASFTTAGGTLPIALVVATAEGCLSDTFTARLNIGFHPHPQFAIEGRLCNNEIIYFADQSSMPAGLTGDMITKWHWTFDGAATTSVQNPSADFSAGIHKAQLIAETNIGCKSVALEQRFTIYPKPTVTASISDSCVLVPVTYTGHDLAGNVTKWKWNFGDGFTIASAGFTRTYYTEGDRTFTLLTQTDKGCIDTLYRPFNIFRNKSFAGRDTIAAFGEPVQLNANGAPGMQYTWSPSTGLDNWDIEKPVATLDREQLYKLNTVSDKGCKQQSQILIKRYAGPELYIPNAFSPNNDGVNDLFRVIPIGIKTFGYLAVYNKWGQLIYRTTNYHEGWDGRFRGEQLPTATFIYIAQAIDYRGQPMFRKGTVTLLR
jgi:gliding motility-associated-like protein